MSYDTKHKVFFSFVQSDKHHLEIGFFRKDSSKSKCSHPSFSQEIPHQVCAFIAKLNSFFHHSTLSHRWGHHCNSSTFVTKNESFFLAKQLLAIFLYCGNFWTWKNENSVAFSNFFFEANPKFCTFESWRGWVSEGLLSDFRRYPDGPTKVDRNGNWMKHERELSGLLKKMQTGLDDVLRHRERNVMAAFGVQCKNGHIFDLVFCPRRGGLYVWK